MLNRVEEILNKEVRPYLMSHGGNLKVESIEDGIVKVKFMGSCSCCPSARITLEETVWTALKDISEIKKIELTQAISDETLDFAKKLLKK